VSILERQALWLSYAERYSAREIRGDALARALILGVAAAVAGLVSMRSPDAATRRVM
jgi:hypothetical protein